MRILVVSPTDATRAWIRGALDPAWEFLEARDGLEALAIARAEPIDLIVAAETTEPYGAFGLARDTRLLDHPPSVIIILDRAQDAWLAQWSTADRWLVSPADPFELAAAARELLEEPASPDQAESAEPVAG